MYHDHQDFAIFMYLLLICRLFIVSIAFLYLKVTIFSGLQMLAILANLIANI